MAKPVRVSSLTAGVLGGFGDYINQSWIEQHDNYVKNINLWRILKMGIVGLTFYGPHTVYYYWYINPWLMDTFFPRLFPKFLKAGYSKWKRVFMSAFFDTFIYNLPYFSVALFYAGLLSHKGNVSKAWENVKNQAFKAYTTGWFIYPIPKFFLYGTIPRYIRGIASIAFRLVWLIIFSFIVHNYWFLYM